MTDVNQDLNQVITSAIQARIEVAVVEAMSGDEVFSTWISAALNQQVEVSGADRYSKVKVPWIRDVIYKAIQKATREAVEEAIEVDRDRIQKEVAKHVRSQSAGLASLMMDQLTASVKSDYRTSVSVSIESLNEKD